MIDKVIQIGNQLGQEIKIHFNRLDKCSVKYKFYKIPTIFGQNESVKFENTRYMKKCLYQVHGRGAPENSKERK